MKFLITITLLTLVLGCTKPEPTRQPISILNKPVARPTLSVPAIDQYRSRKVDWIIVTPENADEIFSKLESTGQPVVLFGVTETGYKNVSLNMQDILNIIVQQRSVIDSYRKYYVEVDGVIYEFNQSLKK